MGMSVLVVGTDADQCHLRVHRLDEHRLTRRGAVMRDREQLRLEPVGAAAQQSLLSGRSDVSGEQGATAVVMDPQHVRRFVELAGSVAVRPSRRWVEHLDSDVTEPRHHPGERGDDRRATRRGDTVHLGHLREPGGQRSGPHRVDGDAADHLGDSAHMIKVRMGHDQQVELAHTVAP